MKIKHLTDEASDLCQKTDQERIQYILQDHWVGYPQAMKIMNRMKGLLEMPTIERMPNLLLIGETNNGKSAILKRYNELYPSHIGQR